MANSEEAIVVVPLVVVVVQVEFALIVVLVEHRHVLIVIEDAAGAVILWKIPSITPPLEFSWG